MDNVAPSTTRRRVLAGASAGAAGALAGCWERLWSQAETAGPEQVSMTIKTVPADDDELATAITSRLRENYRAAGIDATREVVTKAEFFRDVLLEGDYDVFVVKHPGLDEPDGLHGLLHSRFVGESGWQNPFQYSDVTTDEYLEHQRRAGAEQRPDVLEDLIAHLLETTPYTVVAYPYTLSGVRDDISLARPPRRPRDYFDILSHPNNESRDGPLQVGVFGEGLTDRLNPLTVDQNRIEGLLDLLYDPLARRIGDESVPWLAADIEWENDGREARITLRDGLEWHDGESLDADDVAFTYRFIGDTSLGEVDGGVPASRFRDRQTLVRSTEVVDSRTIILRFVESTRPVARRAFTVPILPEHIWAERSNVVANRQTEALSVNNEAPIGSGLFAFSEATADFELVLEPFEEHVLRETEDRPLVLENFSQFEGIRFQVSPNPDAMVETLIEGEVDVTATQLLPEHAQTIREASDVSIVTGRTNAFYMIGYNSHHPELGNPRFRQRCSRLVDREHVVDELFDSYATAAATANAFFGIRDDQVVDDEEYSTPATNPLSFPGSDGELDVVQAQSLFEEIGYSYENGELLSSDRG